jgi:hypothetical protein
MILLDTGIVSEAMKPSPDPVLREWLDAQRAESLFIASVSVAELLAAIGSLPQGTGKDQLAKALERILQLFSGRMLTFDTIAAFAYAELAMKAKTVGKSFATADLYLAAIASGQGLTLVSRQPYLFDGLGLLVIDPGNSAD